MNDYLFSEYNSYIESCRKRGASYCIHSSEKITFYKKFKQFMNSPSFKVVKPVSINELYHFVKTRGLYITDELSMGSAIVAFNAFIKIVK